MTTHEMSLNTPWWEFVQNGSKIYEGRRATEKVRQILPGDRIVFCHVSHDSEECDPITVEVVEMLCFPTFQSALEFLPICDVLPIDGITVAEGVEIYKRYVSIPTQLKDGVVMIKIKLCDVSAESTHASR